MRFLPEVARSLFKSRDCRPFFTFHGDSKQIVRQLARILQRYKGREVRTVLPALLVSRRSSHATPPLPGAPDRKRF